MAGTLLARLQPHRAVLVKDQELPARGQGPHSGATGRGAGRRHRAGDEGRHPRLVQALRLLVGTRVKDAIAINSTLCCLKEADRCLYRSNSSDESPSSLHLSLYRSARVETSAAL